MAYGRAHFLAHLTDLEGNALSGATVTLYNQGTTTPISATIYANDTDLSVLTNPLTAGTNGKVEFYLATPARLSMKIEKSGYTTTTETIDVLFASTGSAHIIREDAVAETIRGALMFLGADFDLSDDAVDNETVITIAAAIARLAGTNTWSAAQVFSALATFATGGTFGIKVGTSIRLTEIAGELYLTWNATHNGTDWVRLLADNDAGMLNLTAAGGLKFYTPSDGFSTVGSVITFTQKFAIDKAGALTVIVDGWTAPTFQNSWANKGAPWTTAGYYKDPFGIVHLRGVIDSGVAPIAFNLPAGYRPVAAEHFPSVSITGGSHAGIQIDAAGDVTILTVPSSTALAAVSFRTS